MKIAALMLLVMLCLGCDDGVGIRHALLAAKLAGSDQEACFTVTTPHDLTGRYCIRKVK